jgi:hypothetical protein
MLVSTAGKAERSLPIRPRFGEATPCVNAEFPSWRRNDQVNVIDGTSTLLLGVFAGCTAIASSAEGWRQPGRIL